MRGLSNEKSQLTLFPYFWDFDKFNLERVSYFIIFSFPKNVISQVYTHGHFLFAGDYNDPAPDYRLELAYTWYIAPETYNNVWDSISRSSRSYVRPSPDKVLVARRSSRDAYGMIYCISNDEIHLCCRHRSPPLYAYTYWASHVMSAFLSPHCVCLYFVFLDQVVRSSCLQGVISNSTSKAANPRVSHCLCRCLVITSFSFCSSMCVYDNFSNVIDGHQASR
jgi:hypothetical protein